MVQLETVPRSLLPDCNIQPPGSNNNNNQKTPATSNANQKLTSDSLSGPDAALVSSVKRWTEDMGNLCNIQAGGARVSAMLTFVVIFPLHALLSIEAEIITLDVTAIK